MDTDKGRAWTLRGEDGPERDESFEKSRNFMYKKSFMAIMRLFSVYELNPAIKPQ